MIRRATFTGIVAGLLSSSPVVSAAGSPPPNPPAIFVVVQEGCGISEPGLRAGFEARLLALVSRSGLSGTDAVGDFVLFPRISVVKHERTEGGLESLDVAVLEVTLVVKDARKNVVFDTFSTQVNGGGRTQDEAIRGALLSLSLNTPGLQEFLERSRTKIVSFYEANCKDVLAIADLAARGGRFQEAMADLAAVPSAGPVCFARATKRMQSLLDEEQKAFCQNALAKGQSRLALGDFSGAVSAVSGVSAWAGPCFASVKQFVATVETRVKDREDRNWQAAWRLYEDRLRTENESAARTDAMETRRLETARSIAEAWAKGQRSVSIRTVILN